MYDTVATFFKPIYLFDVAIDCDRFQPILYL